MAQRDSVLENLDKVKNEMGARLTLAKKELESITKESHEVQNKQIEALRKDTEVQLHGICSMIEDVGKMIKESEDRLQAQVPQKLDERLKMLESHLSKLKATSDKSMSAL